MAVPENSPIRRQHFDVTDVEHELSGPLDTAASRGNKGKNPILFSVCGRHLSPRLSEQKNGTNVLPSESLSSLFVVNQPFVLLDPKGEKGRSVQGPLARA